MEIIWRPIQTAPNDGRAFLAIGSMRQQWICAKLNGRIIGLGQATVEVANTVAKTATHWIPLPEPPPGLGE